MAKNRNPGNKKQTKSPNGRPTIGFLTGFRGQVFHHQIWCGIADVAREHNINAICFDGNYVYDPEDFNAQANILYDLIDTEQLDGLVIWDLMCNMLDPNGRRQFYERYRPLPIVSIGGLMEGITGIRSDNSEGMRQAIVHMIEVHGCRRIAFIKGLPNFRAHDERYQAYVDVLAEYGLPFDPARVAVPRDSAEMEQPGWGQVALCRLLDEQKADFDALVTTNDRFVHELLPELQVRGIRIPDDMALVSFDDAEGSNYLTPPLTTVPVPMYELGQQAAETLLGQIEGQKALARVKVVSHQLIVRQSCGCLAPKVMQAAAGPVVRTKTAEPFAISLAKQRTNILTEMVRVAEDSRAGLNPGWVEQLLDGFVATLTSASTGEVPARFLSTLDEILRQVIAAEGNIGAWQKVLSALRRQLLPYFSADQVSASYRDRAEDLWQQAQVMIGDVGQRAQAYRDLLAEQRKRILSETGTALSTNFDVNDLADILAQELPRLGISRGYLSLYENPQPYRYPQPVPQWSRLVLAFDERAAEGSRRVELEAGGRRFLSRQLVPPDILPQQEPYHLMVQALYFQNEQIGFVVFELGPDDGSVYELLRAQISSALKGALLFQEAQIAKKKADLANKAKSSFLANMSHELRTPLNSILGFTQILERRVKDPNILDGLMVIQQSGEHLLTLINDLLDLAKVEAGKVKLHPTNLNLPHLLDGVAGIIRNQATAKNIDLIIQRANTLPGLVHVDGRRLRQVLLNLLSNAIKYTNEGQIKLHVEVVEVIEEANQNQNDFEPPQARLRFSVADTGIGISHDHLERIFQPFEQVGITSEEVKGTGLGLAISQQLVTLMGSHLQVESELGLGSTFWFELALPVVETMPLENNLRASQIIGYLGPPHKILVVDDEAYNRQLLQEMLEPLGFLVQMATDGQEAMDMALTWQPSAILMDVIMPGKSGFTATRELRQHPHGQKITIIAISASVLETAIEEAYQAGCDDFLRKPFRERALLAMLGKHLEIEYVREEEETAVTPPKPLDTFTLESLAALPRELLSQLETAAMLANIGKVTALIEEVEKFDTAVAAALTTLSEEFEYPRITSLIQAAKKSN